MPDRMKVLLMVDWFAPGYKAGGPIRSAVNFADQLESSLDLRVLTSDRDLGDAQAYPDVATDKWLTEGSHQVYYASPGKTGWSAMRETISQADPDLVYLNSMFSWPFALQPLLMKRMGLLRAAAVLAPRGMLRSSALAHKSAKKKVFLRAFRMAGLHRMVTFHATDQQEEQDVRAHFGDKARVFRADNLPGKQKPFQPAPTKRKGQLQMIFVGRMHPIKNLDLLLRAMAGVNAQLHLDVVAPPEDKGYQEDCRALINALPKGMTVNLLGNVPHEGIAERLLSSQLFVLPTRGENFGHAIFEALAAGRPVLISDQTPWRGLAEKQAGWDLPIGDPVPFTMALQRVADMEDEEFSVWCRGAWDIAYRFIEGNGLKETYIKQFSQCTS